jgi:hypothetical protein
MAEFFEGVADQNGLLAVDEEGTHFGLGGRGPDVAEDVADGVEGGRCWAVDGLVRWLDQPVCR